MVEEVDFWLSSELGKSLCDGSVKTHYKLKEVLLWLKKRHMNSYNLLSEIDKESLDLVR